MDIKAEIERIARAELNVETLETRGRDSLDFHEVSVEGIRRALLAAYMLGVEECAEAEQNQYPHLTADMLAAIAVSMDDTVREQLHSARDWHHPGEFLTAYMQRDPAFPLHQFRTGD